MQVCVCKHSIEIFNTVILLSEIFFESVTNCAFSTGSVGIIGLISHSVTISTHTYNYPWKNLSLIVNEIYETYSIFSHLVET